MAHSGEKSTVYEGVAVGFTPLADEIDSPPMRDKTAFLGTADEETRKVLEALQKRIRDSGKSYREVEKRARIGQDYLRQVLRGSVQLKVAHVLAVLRAIELPPGDFFHEALDPPLPPPAVREEAGQDDPTATAVGVLQHATLRMMIWKCKDDGVFTSEEAQRLLETLNPAHSQG